MSASAPAQSYSVRRVGDWIVTASSDEPGCFLTRQYAGDGGTTLLFGLNADNKNHLSVLNGNWSIKPKARLELDFRLSGRRYPKQAAVGMASNGRRGFVTGFAPGFQTIFATSRFLSINRGDVPVARLSLDGSGSAVTEMKRCVAASRVDATLKPSVENDSARVPKDPFSSDLDEQPRKTRASTRDRDARDND